MMSKATRQAAAIPDDFRPRTAAEVSEEMAKLRDLAQRVRLQPESVKRVATRWLQPWPDELAALTRWYNGAIAQEPRGMLAADLGDAVKLVAKATTPERWRDDPEAMAARLEHFAKSLEPQLCKRLQRTPEERQAMNAAVLEYVRARRVGGVLPKYATAELRADPIEAMLRAGDEMAKLEKELVRCRDLHGGLPNTAGTRIEAAWLRARNLLSRVVGDAAALVVRSGDDPSPLFMAAETAKQGRAGEFVQQWPAVATVLMTTQAKLKATPPAPQGSAGAVAEEVAGDAAGANDGCKLAILKPSERLAYLAHQYAEMKEDRQLTDPEAWEYLNEYGIGKEGDELESYNLPLRDTYADYMNRARRKLGESKHSPRGGRASRSRSVRKRSEI